MKNQVQLADIFKAPVKSLDKHLYQIQNAQFTFRAIHTENEVQCCVVPDKWFDKLGFKVAKPVYKLKIRTPNEGAAFQEIADIIVPFWHLLECFTYNLLLLFLRLLFLF